MRATERHERRLLSEAPAALIAGRPAASASPRRPEPPDDQRRHDRVRLERRVEVHDLERAARPEIVRQARQQRVDPREVEAHRGV